MLNFRVKNSFVGTTLYHALILVRLIFVAATDYENIHYNKISRFMVPYSAFTCSL